jgi:hypothetical protein
MKTLLLILSMTLAIPAMAEMTKEEAMKKMQEASKPGPEQKMLADMAGKWTYTSKMWESPESKPEETKGKSTMKMILGGRILQQNASGMAMGQKFEGMGFTAFDNLKKEWNTTWMDSMGTSIMHGTGTYDEATKTITDKGSFTCPMEEDMTAEYRSEWKMIDKNNMMFTMYGQGMGKQKAEFKMMEMAYKRAK